MKNFGSAFLGIILFGSLVSLPTIYAQPSVQAELLMSELISSMEGMRVTIFRTEIPPGYIGVSHRHPGETFVYVLSGRVLNQIDEEEPKIYQAGEFFFEPANALHARFENPDTDSPAVYIVFGIRPDSRDQRD